MLNVVSAPRVINNCFPISTTSMSLVGLLSRSTMMPASRAAWVPVFHGDPDVGLGERRGVVGASRSWQSIAAGLLQRMRRAILGLGLRDEIVHAASAAIRRRRQRVCRR